MIHVALEARDLAGGGFYRRAVATVLQRGPNTMRTVTWVYNLSIIASRY